MKFRTDSRPTVVPPLTAEITGQNTFGKTRFHFSSLRRLFFKWAANSSTRVRSAAGFTLAEMMVATAMASLLVASVIALGMFATKSFNIMGNYVDLDAQSRHASDVMSQQIRDASALVAYSTNYPSYLELTNSINGQLTFIIYSPSSSKLWMGRTGNATATSWNTLLTHCDDWTFSLYNRAPNISSNNVTFFTTTNAVTCKMINMTWKCSRRILGAKLNTESVQTAEIVLRNQITK